MGKRFDRALLLCPEKYSLFNSLSDILSEIAGEVTGYDILSGIGSGEMKINSQAFRLPHSLRRRWESRFLHRANSMLLDMVQKADPDVVMVYNSVYLLPETCERISRRARLIFFMGDSPFYTPQNNYYLACLAHAHLILSPDSLWNEQLNTMGLRNTLYFIPGPDTRTYHRAEPGSANNGEREREILYVGSCYLNSWGYKKAYLMSRFTGFDFEIYGNSAWKRWFPFFPELEAVYRGGGFIASGRLNSMFNRAAIIPVDGNPGIINGVHLRMFEALASGCMPLTEYRKDIDSLLFSGFEGEVPVIRDYRSAGETARRYLMNAGERREITEEMYTFIMNRYSPAMNAGRLLEAADGAW